ncbi:hypothetical protein KKG66_07110, partial [bacterium]|nr:hypothetical protein [bacterium]
MRASALFSRLFLILMMSLVLVLGCEKEDDDNPTGPADNFSLWVVQGDDSTEVSEEGLPTFEIDGLTCIHFSEFIDTTLIPPYNDDGDVYDRRPLYCYQIEGADGFSAHTHPDQYPNNTWYHLTQGYLTLSTERAGFPSELGLPGAYRVSDVARIRVFRKLDLVAPDTTVFTEFRDVTSVEVTNHDGNLEQALPLVDFIDDAVIADPANYVFNITAIDGYGTNVDMSWAEFQTGYWLLESEKTIFTDET